MQKSIEEETSRIYGLYEKKSRSFRTTFYSVSGLVVIFFGLVFYPYVSTLGEKSLIDRNLAALDEDIRHASSLVAEHLTIVRDFVTHQQAVEQRIGAFRWAELESAAQAQAAKLQELRVRLRDDPDAAGWARGQAAPPAISPQFLRRHPDLRETSKDPCLWLGNDAWIRCVLADHVRQAHDFATRPLRYARISHLRNELLPPLAARLDDLEKAFRTWLLGQSSGWREGRPGTAAANPRTELGAFWGTYRENFVEHHRAVLQQRFALENRLAQWERERARLRDAQARAENMLEQVQSFRNVETPIGQLPVGLDELVLIFPALLAAGFLACASLLADTLRLRQAFHRFTRELDPERRLFTDDHVALVAPLWLDPIAGRWGRAATLAILSIPALVFVSAVGLLVFHRLLLTDFPEAARLPAPVYIVLYVLCCGLIAEGFRRIARELRRYQRGLLVAPRR